MTFHRDIFIRSNAASRQIRIIIFIDKLIVIIKFSTDSHTKGTGFYGSSGRGVIFAEFTQKDTLLIHGICAMIGIHDHVCQ